MTATKIPKDVNQLQKLHNRYKGRRGFIIGSGPSLASVPRPLLEKLKDEATIGLNLVLKSDLPFAPTMLALCLAEWQWTKGHGLDWLVDQLMGTTHRLPPLKFYANEVPSQLMWDAGFQFVAMRDGERMDDTGRVEGMGDYLSEVSVGHSVATAAIQIALWLGFDPIYLLGCDASRDGHAYDQDDPAIREDQAGFVASAAKCEEVMAVRGRTLIDLTQDGNLTITKGSLAEVLGAKEASSSQGVPAV